MQRELLPARPLRLGSRFRNRALTLVIIFGGSALLIGAVFAGMFWKHKRLIDREEQVWTHGLPCADGTYAVRETTHGTSIDFTCRGADDLMRTGTMESDLSIHQFTGEWIEARYHPTSPHEFALSSSIDQLEQRRAAIRRVAIVGGGFVGLLLAIAAGFLRRLLRLRRIVRCGDELVVTIERVEPVMRGKHVTHMRNVAWRAGPSQRKPFRLKMDAKQGLAWTSATESLALALMTPDRKHGILLTGVLHQIALTDEERAKVAQRLESVGGGMARGELGMIADWIVISPADAKAAKPSDAASS